MDLIQGNITGVEIHENTSLAEDAIAGNNYIIVGDPTLLNSVGGELLLEDSLLVYIAVDKDTGIVTLEETLEEDVPELTKVAPSPSQPQKRALVSFAGDAEDAHWCLIPHELEGYIPTGVRDEDLQEYVEISEYNGEYEIFRYLNERPRFDGGIIDPSTLPEPGTDGMAPPQVAAVVAAGGIRAIYLSWAPVDNQSPVRYRVYGGTATNVPIDEQHYITQTSGTRTTVYSVWDDLTDVMVDKLTPGTEYFFKVVSIDDDVSVDTPAIPSAEISGTPVQITEADVAAETITGDMIRGNTIESDKMASVLSVSNRYEIGDYMSIEAGQGLKTEPPNGKSVQIRDDGGTSIFEGEITVDRAIITDFLDVQGSLGKISGLLNIADGVVAPTAAPIVSTSWNSPLATQETERSLGAGPAFDLKGYDEQNWLYLETVFDSFTVWAMNKESAERILLFAPPQRIFAIGVERVGDHILVIGKKFGNGDRFDTVNGQDRFRLFVYSMSGELQAIKEWTPTDIYNDPAIVSAGYGTGFLVAYVTDRPDKRVRVEQYSIGYSPATQTYSVNATTSIDVPTLFPYTTTKQDMDLTGACVSFGDYDNGQNYLFLTTKDYVLAHFVTITTAPLITAISYNHVWTKPNNELMRGIEWSDGRFHTGGATTGRIYHFAKQMGIYNYQWRFSYYDSDPIGGTHETQGGVAVSFQNTRRHWIRVATPSPVIQSGGVDDPDAARFYANGKLQATVAGSPDQNSVVFLDEIDAAGASAPTTNGFASVAGQNGALQSGKTDTNGALIRLEGGGGGRLGDKSWDALGVWDDLESSALGIARTPATAGGAGTSKKGARADHTHPPALLSNSNATLGTNVSGSANGYRANDGTMFTNFSLTASANLSVGHVLCTLPVGSRPPVVWFVDLNNIGPNTTVRVHIGTNGECVTQHAITSGQTLRGSAAFPFSPA